MNITSTYKTRLVAAAATGLLALGLCAGTAMAKTSATDVDDSQVTITGVAAGDTVSAWRIFDANIDATNNLTYTKTDGLSLPENYDTVDELTSITSNSDGSKTAADAIANALAKANVAATETATATENGAQLSLDSGYYLVRVTATNGNTCVYQNMLINVSPDVQNGAYVTRNLTDQNSVGVKSEPITAPEKKIVASDSTSASESDGYSVGDTVNFQITGAFPSYPANATNAKYTVTDTPETGLELTESSFKVTVNDSDLTSGTDYTLSKSDADGTWSISFNSAYLLNNGGQAYTITYNGKVISVDATDGTLGNSAKATFNPNPYSNGTSTTDPSTTDLKTYGFCFTKIAGDTNEALPGAEFQVKYANGEVVKDANGSEITLTSDSNGYVSLGGLAAGTYTITETKVPTGYQKVDDFTVELSSTTATGNNPATGDVTETNYFVMAKNVVDPKQGVLPTTGGEGTVALTAAGVVLMAGAAGFVVFARRRSNR